MRGLWFVLFAFLSAGLTGTAFAFDSLPPPFAQDGNNQPAQISLHDVAHEVGYWPAHCAEMEIDRSIVEASRCWWFAAEEIARHATDSRALADEVEKLRVHWLWRGTRLSLRSPTPGRPAPSLIEPAAQSVTGPDPARVTGAPACASILASDREKCLGTVAAALPVKKVDPPRKKTAVAWAKKKKIATAKPKAPPAPKKARKKKEIFEAAVVRAEEAALPLVPRLQRGTNLTPRAQSRKSKNTAEIDDWYR